MLISPATTITISTINSILPIAEKSLSVFIAKIDSPPKATVVKINAFATICPPAGVPKKWLINGEIVKPETKVNAKSIIRLSPGDFLVAYNPNKSANSKITNPQYQVATVETSPSPTYAPTEPARSEAANSW